MPAHVPSRLLALVLSCAAQISCGSEEPACALGRSGVESCKTVAELDADERRALCEWATQEKGGEGTTYSCAGDLLVIIGSPDDCLPFASLFERPCSATVEALEGCAHALRVAYSLCAQQGLATVPACSKLVEQAGCEEPAVDAGS